MGFIKFGFFFLSPKLGQPSKALAGFPHFAIGFLTLFDSVFSPACIFFFSILGFYYSIP